MTGGLTKKSRADVGMVKGRKKMKDKVDRILNGETVDITGDGADYYLSVLQDNDKYKIGFVNPNYVIDSYQRLGTKQMKEAGNLLIELANELESRRKFKAGDSVYYIRQDEEIRHIVFSLNNAYHYGLVMSGNAFKTKSEAEAHKDEVLAKYQELRDKGLV